MKIYSWALAILLAFTGFPALAQQLPSGIQRLVSKIKQKNELKSEFVGYAAVTPEQYHDFIALRDSASLEVLLRLTRHHNAVVRGYAGWALADRQYAGLPTLFTYFLQHPRKVKTMHGCIGGNNELASEFYFRVVNYGLRQARTHPDSVFYAGQLAQLDSILLYHHPRHRLADYALKRNAANPRRYQIIKTIYQQDSSSTALTALAEYHRPEDVALLQQAGFSAFAGITRFPDSAFWPLLTSVDLQVFAGKDNLNASFYLSDYYRALASYQDERSAAFIRGLYQHQPVPRPAKLVVVLTETNNPVYHDILLDLWVTDKMMLVPAVQATSAAQPEAAAQAFAKGMLSSVPYSEDDPSSDYRFDSEIIPLMLHHLERYNAAAIPAICNYNVLTADFLALEKFLDYVQSKRIQVCKPAIMTRLQGPNSAFNMFHLTQAALAYNDPALKPELQRLLTEKQKDWDQYNWSSSFRKLLTANGITIAAGQ
ncbi:hypothetical protein LRS06_19260 [Hymenobacter sp. J193]|uniref:hypothetical protein n=1 Tax=Hymenobacter sp. J193 TaxID=2898429 RepID=UPI00215096BB|nr:hypothetical protein [Hymenobacter sp. J193]MCR5889871.1 hypothetical protein [Hymenobacter sp. J193]